MRDEQRIFALGFFDGVHLGHRALLDACVELAKERGVKTVLITRYPKSPAAKLASVVLCCGSSESPFQFGSVPAKVAQLTVLDVLFQEYLHRNREACEESVQQIAAALSGKHI